MEVQVLEQHVQVLLEVWNKMVKDKEDKLVEKELKQVEQGKETPKQAEKDIAESISKEQVKKEKKEKPKEEDKKVEEKKEKPKDGKKTITVKKEAVVNARNIPVSTKHSVAICNFIRNKDIDQAIIELELVARFKKPLPMKGEIPHKKGIMSGRYPVKAAIAFIRLLKSLKANAIVNELELEKFKLFCVANTASRPYKRFGRGRFKRTNATLKLVKIGAKKK